MDTVRNQVIIDTDIMVDLLRGKEKVVAFIADLEKRGLTLSTTSINAFELFYGACKSKKKLQNLAAARKLLGRLIVLKLGLKSAEKAGQIYAELEGAGQPVGLRDVMVGAIAMVGGCAMVTRNVVHLKKIKGLNLMVAP
ncbi:MAG: type II toxin-antitoxin system VapC family toxin [Candidatus Bathyarchaeia archaeon]